MTTILERAMGHYSGLGKTRIEIPEWPDDEGKPTVLYSTPCTLAEKAKIFRGMGKEKDDLSALAMAVAMKAETADGKRAFSMADVEDLKRGAAADVVSRVAMQILDYESVEDMEKN